MPLGVSFEFPCVVIMIGIDRESPFVRIGVWGAPGGLRLWRGTGKIVLSSTLVWCKPPQGSCCYFYYVFIWFRPCVLCRRVDRRFYCEKDVNSLAALVQHCD